MPFIAVNEDGQPLLPVNVASTETAICPRCDEQMKVKDGETIARHFYHPPNTACNGESAAHLAMKSIASQKLRTKYKEATVRVEFKTEDTPRRADVFVDFSEPRPLLGAGIAVEVQYRNDAKDITETTADYLRGGISVIWLFEENYEGERPDYDDVELQSPIPVWPFAVPHGPSLDESATKAEFLNVAEEDLAPYLALDSAGQLSITEFDTTPDQPNPPTRPDWSLQSTIHLNVSPSSPGAKELYRSWIDGLIKEQEDERRGSVRGRKQPRYLSKRFWRGKGDTFEIGLDAHRNRPSRFWVKKFNGDSQPEFGAYVDGPITEQVTEFVTQVCYGLECTRDLAPVDRERVAVWTESIDESSVEVYRTDSVGVQVRFGRGADSISVDFDPNHLQKLAELCAEIRLWYGPSTTP